MRRSFKPIAAFAAAAFVFSAGQTFAQSDSGTGSPGVDQERTPGMQDRDPNQGSSMDRPQKHDPKRDRADTDEGRQTYVVREGDTLGKIAQEVLGSRDEWRRIAQLNDISDPRALRVGQELVLPPNARGGSDFEMDRKRDSGSSDRERSQSERTF